MYILKKVDRGIIVLDKKSGQSRYLSYEEEIQVLNTIPELLAKKLIPFSVDKSHRNILKHEITNDYIKNSFFYTNN